MEKNENIQININKKSLLKGLGILAVVALILGLSFAASKSYGAGFNFKFNDITVDEYLGLLEGSEKEIIYVARPTCSYCQLESPIIKKIGNKYNLKINYLNTENFFDEETNDYTEEGKKFINSHEVYKEGYGTPNTIIVQNGDIVDGVYQYVDEESLLELFKNNGFINE